MKIFRNQGFVNIFLILIIVALAGIAGLNIFKSNSSILTYLPLPHMTPQSASTSTTLIKSKPTTTPSIIPKLTSALSAAEVWTKRDDLVNKKIVIEDIVTLREVCREARGEAGTCEIWIYIGNLSANPLRLLHYSNSSEIIKCSGMQTICHGFENGKRYRIKGILMKDSTNLKDFYTYSIEIETKIDL